METPSADRKSPPTGRRSRKRGSGLTLRIIAVLIVFAILRGLNREGTLLPQLNQWQFFLLLFLAGAALIGFIVADGGTGSFLVAHGPSRDHHHRWRARCV
jgi:hypothetical protein